MYLLKFKVNKINIKLIKKIPIMQFSIFSTIQIIVLNTEFCLLLTIQI